jgi:hypothetical protein
MIRCARASGEAGWAWRRRDDPFRSGRSGQRDDSIVSRDDPCAKTVGARDDPLRSGRRAA